MEGDRDEVAVTPVALSQIYFRCQLCKPLSPRCRIAIIYKCESITSLIRYTSVGVCKPNAAHRSEKNSVRYTRVIKNKVK